MRRWSLALLVALASPALAQAPAPAAEPAQAPPAAPTPETKAPEPKAAPAEPKAPPAELKPAPAKAKPAPTEAKPAPAEPKPAPAEAKPAPTQAQTAPAAPAPAPAAAKAAPAPAVQAPAAAAVPVPAAPVPAPKPPAAPPVPAVAAVPVEEKKFDDVETEKRQRVKSEARHILENLLTGDARGTAGSLLYPFQVKDKRYNSPEELVAAWVKQLRVKRTDLMTLYDVEVLSRPEMEKKYGKPPARLGLGSLKDPDIYVAVGNLSGHAAVLLFRAPQAAHPKALAYTD